MAPSAAVVESVPVVGTPDDEPAVADVLVAIVSFHCRDDVVACVESVRRSTAGLEVDLVVADNGSADGTVATLVDHPAGVRVLDLGRNTGFAHASNRAIESGPSRSILLLNPDTTVEPGAIETLSAWLDDHPGTGVVAPRLVNPDGSDQQTARAFPTPAAAIFGRRSPLTRLFPRNRWSTRFLTGRDHDGDDPFPIDWVSGAALMVPRSVADEVGLLDEGYFLFWEDADWCRRIKDAGYEVWCVPTATVVHHEGGTRGHGWATPVVRHFHSGAYRYWRLHHAPQAWNPLRWTAAAALAARAAAIVSRERTRSALSARRARTAVAVPSPTHRSDQNR
jgi:N-acetylglucosaminyl-diphospho-decaprenol L-rhamnosyltransferase